MSTPTRRGIEKLCRSWSYEQIRSFVKEVREETREAWQWMTPRVHEALIAERAFATIRAQHRGIVEVRDMDGLLAAMRVLAGLATIEEVDDSPLEELKIPVVTRKDIQELRADARKRGDLKTVLLANVALEEETSSDAHPVDARDECVRLIMEKRTKKENHR